MVHRQSLETSMTALSIGASTCRPADVLAGTIVAFKTPLDKHMAMQVMDGYG